MSGKLDYGGEPRLALGIACNPMPAAAIKRLWPAFISPKVRDWVIEHIVSGNVERIDIATNATLAADADRRSADAGGRPVDRDRRQRGDAAAGRGAADDPRCRHERCA